MTSAGAVAFSNMLGKGIIPSSELR